jgi:hypothetical protein
MEGLPASTDVILLGLIASAVPAALLVKGIDYARQCRRRRKHGRPTMPE